MTLSYSTQSHNYTKKNPNTIEEHDKIRLELYKLQQLVNEQINLAMFLIYK